MLRIIGRVDVDAGRAIVERSRSPDDFLLEGDELAELVDARRSSPSRVISKKRSTEKRSTANEPIAQPHTTARRMFASLRSPVRAR